jgi:hypothetical protein
MAAGSGKRFCFREYRLSEVKRAAAKELMSECGKGAKVSHPSARLLYREGLRRLGAAYVYFEEEPGRRAAAKAAHSRRGAAGCGEHSPRSRCYTPFAWR